MVSSDRLFVNCLIEKPCCRHNDLRKLTGFVYGDNITRQCVTYTWPEKVEIAVSKSEVAFVIQSSEPTVK